MKKKFTPKYALQQLSIIIASLVVLSSIGIILQHYVNNRFLDFFVKLFYLNNEMSIPAFYSACALMVAGIMLIIIALKLKELGNKYVAWLVLGFIFIFLSFDEICVIHEHFSNLIQNSYKTTGFLYYGWVIPYGILILVLGATYFKFVMALPSKVRLYMILSGGIFLMGSVGIEMITAKVHSSIGVDNWLYILLMTIEESMEMFGIALFIYTLFLYINIEFGTLKITVKTIKKLPEARNIGA